MASTVTDRFSGFNLGAAIKAPVYVASTGNLTLSSTQTIDGIAVPSSFRVLVKNQTASTDNGIYVVAASAWARAKDFDGAKDAVPGTRVFVDRGTVNGGTAWIANSSATATAIDIGTDAITFTQVSNSVTEKASGIYNVKDYGAVGDGSTDDLTAINNAIDAATTNGGTVIVPPGTYAVSNDIIFKSNIRFIGHGRPTIKLTAARSIWCRINTGADNVIIDGIIFDANNNVSASGRLLTTNGGVGSSTGGNYQILNCRFQDTGGSPVTTILQGALYFERGSNILVRGCEFDNLSNPFFAGQQQASDAAAASGVTIEWCVFTDWTKSAIELRGGTENPRHFRVLNNRILQPKSGDNSVTTPHSIWVDGLKTEGTAPTGTPTNSICDVVVAYNYCEGGDVEFAESPPLTNTAVGDMIVFRGVEDGAIIGNECYNGGEHAFSVNYGSKNISVVGNKAERPNANGFNIGVIDATYNSNVVKTFNISLLGNTARDVGLSRTSSGAPTNFMIRIHNTQGCMVVGNTLYDTQSTATSDNAVRIAPTAKDVESRSNYAYYEGVTSNSVNTHGLTLVVASSAGSGPSGEFFADEKFGTYKSGRLAAGSSTSLRRFLEWREHVVVQSCSTAQSTPWTYSPSTNASLWVTAEAYGHREGGGNIADFMVRGSFRRTSSDVNTVGTVTTLYSAADTTTTTFTLAGSSASLQAQLVTNTTVATDWYIDIKAREIHDSTA